MGLASRHCVPLKKGTPPLSGERIQGLLAQLAGGWKVTDAMRLVRELRFRDFRQAMDFANRIADLAEAEQHHPDLLVAWGKMRVTLTTHSVGGLSDNDFILAAKIDSLRREERASGLA